MESKILSFALIVMATGIGWWFYQVARLCLKATKTQAWVAPIVFWSLNLLSPTIEAIVKDTELASKVCPLESAFSENIFRLRLNSSKKENKRGAVSSSFFFSILSSTLIVSTTAIYPAWSCRPSGQLRGKSPGPISPGFLIFSAAHFYPNTPPQFSPAV